jgi:membrane protease subunit HflK
MPWNEPGNSSNNKDPWTGRPKQTPPDLEAFLRDLRKKIVAFFKLKSFNKNTTAFTKVFVPQLNAKFLGIIFSFLLLTWLFSGFFTVNSSEQAVITRFGKYNTTLSPGRHWIVRPIENHYIISEKNIPYSYQTSLLTRDGNKVSVNTKLDYSIVNARQYLFSNTQPLQSLQEAVAKATHQTLAQFTLDQLLNANLPVLQQTLRTKINTLLTQYATGVFVNDIELNPIQVPEELKASFEALSQALTEKEQNESQAKVYAMQIEPQSKGEAEKLIADAKSYQQEVVLKAKAETARFLALLPAYEASPLLTRKRLYLEALQIMMAHSNKMLINNPENTSISLTVDKSGVQYPDKTTPTQTEKTSAEENTLLNMATPSKTDNETELASNYPPTTGGYE